MHWKLITNEHAFLVCYGDRSLDPLVVQELGPPSGTQTACHEVIWNNERLLNWRGQYTSFHGSLEDHKSN